MIRYSLVASCLLLSITSVARATFPPGPLDNGQFNYNDPQFMGDYFSFGTNLTYTMGTTPNSTVTTTGLTGFSAAASEITPIPGFQSGDNVLLGEQNASDLFPTAAPSPLQDAWANNSITAIGDFQNGFSEISIHQRKVAEVEQESGPFADAFVESKANAPFEFLGPDPTAEALFSVNFDSLFLAGDNGALSEGINVQLLDVTDPENPLLMNELGGFYFLFDVAFDASFTMGSVDLTENFSTSATGTGPDDPFAATFSYEMLIPLDTTKTYALNVQSDTSSGVDGQGRAFIDSSNTLDVSLQLINPNTRFIIPGTTLVPEPSTAGLLVLALLGICNRRCKFKP